MTLSAKLFQTDTISANSWLPIHTYVSANNITFRKYTFSNQIVVKRNSLSQDWLHYDKCI